MSTYGRDAAGAKAVHQEEEPQRFWIGVEGRERVKKKIIVMAQLLLCAIIGKNTCFSSFRNKSLRQQRLLMFAAESFLSYGFLHSGIVTITCPKFCKG
jgi:hypothetical protein